jgi:hypothetical protein
MDAHYLIDMLPPHCGVEIEGPMMRAFTEVDPENRLESEWMAVPTDGRIFWAQFVWSDE